MNSLPTLPELSARLAYDPATGVFTHLRTHRAVQAGDVAGTYHPGPNGHGSGHIRIQYDGQLIYAHRAAFLFMTGAWPTGEVDHLDHDGTNNAWSNLRDTTQAENSRNLNRYRTNTSGRTGVASRPNGAFRARIMVEGRSISLGDHPSFERACTVRRQAEIIFGFHSNHGKALR